jgi:hypothetical protein
VLEDSDEQRLNEFPARLVRGVGLNFTGNAAMMGPDRFTAVCVIESLEATLTTLFRMLEGLFWGLAQHGLAP